MTHFIKPEFLVSLYLILNNKEEVTLKDLGDYAGKLNKELKERKIEAVFLISDKYIDEMLSDYNYFEYNDNYEDEVTQSCIPWIKRKVSNELLSEQFIAYLSNDVLKVATDLNDAKEAIMSTEEKMKVMKAYTEGKLIQSKAVIGEHWCDDTKPTWDWNHFEYRIKLESITYRSYKNSEEMFEDIKKRLDENYGGMQHPVFSGMWLRQKVHAIEEMIAGTDSSDSEKPEFLLLIGDHWSSLEYAFENYTYLDGTPFGIKVE